MRKKDYQTLFIGLPVLVLAAALVFVACDAPPTPFVVVGSGRVTGNVPPTLTIVEPTANITRGQGAPFIIRWADEDPDSSAVIAFELRDVSTTAAVPLVAGIPENDSIGPDSFAVDSSVIPQGSYTLVGTISDGVNAPVEVFATVTGESFAQRTTITIVGQGEGPQTVPPIAAVIEPSINLSVTQDDVLTVVVAPTAVDPTGAVTVFDRDSDAQLFVVFDLDQNPNNDDPFNPDPAEIIVPAQFPDLVTAGTSGVRTFNITIDLQTIPPRPDGEPYFIRTTIVDGDNPPVHQYAVGRINIARLASGLEDLVNVGRTTSGAIFKGFNPGGLVGSKVAHVSDFDADGIDDFVFVARFGNPQNVGPVGEAYLVYGRDGQRFGGVNSVNAISDSISGAIFQAPPVRTGEIPSAFARTDGITDVSFIGDLTEDGRPELLFGLPHVHGAYDSMDYDPGDDLLMPPDDPNPLGCYADVLVNNETNPDEGGDSLADRRNPYAGGMAIIFHSSNRDSLGFINPVRLEDTAVSLEFVGQVGETPATRFLIVLGAESLFRDTSTSSAPIVVRADNDFADVIGTDPQEARRIAGVRITAGPYDFVHHQGVDEGPREGLWGQTVRSIGDIDGDDTPEIVISGPRNALYQDELRNAALGINVVPTQVLSSTWSQNIVIIRGNNYNTTDWRGRGDSETSTIPSMQTGASCSSTPPGARQFDFPPGAIQVFQEEITDGLWEGQSAGDFNQDGIDDLLCGAPFNDRTPALIDSGSVYVIYSRRPFSDIDLGDADDPVQRPPMLRIRGQRLGDQIGWRQTAGLDVNNDGIDDVLIASPRTDFDTPDKRVFRDHCAGDFNGDGRADEADLQLSSFDSCVVSAADTLFSDDPCKAFDYDNDGDLDDDDRCVFCCLSGECTPDDSCLFGQSVDCCANLVDNGFVGVVFGGQFIDGDRTLNQLTTTELEGVVFFGSAAGHRAGLDAGSAGDFNKDGFGDILIVVPGETRLDSAGRERLGVVYLVFGGPHLTNQRFSLAEVGSAGLPGIVFTSAYVKGRPNEAAPESVGFVGDINNDGFGDIAIGIPTADFIDPSFPQGSNEPETGRRLDVGDLYVIYGNNFGSNRVGG